MGLVNPDVYTATSGVALANTYVVLGSSRVYFDVEGSSSGVTYSAATNMQIYKDQPSFMTGCVPVEERQVRYEVPDANAVYQLLYASAMATEGWGNAVVTSP